MFVTGIFFNVLHFDASWTHLSDWNGYELIIKYATGFNRITLVGITKHVYCELIFSECLIELCHPLIGGHRIFVHKYRFAFQTGYVTPVMITKKTYQMCNTSWLTHNYCTHHTIPILHSVWHYW